MTTAGIPRVQSIGFSFPLGQAEWIYQAVVHQGGKQTTLQVRLAPGNIGSIGTAIGQSLAKVL